MVRLIGKRVILPCEVVCEFESLNMITVYSWDKEKIKMEIIDNRGNSLTKYYFNTILDFKNMIDILFKLESTAIKGSDN